jgi:alpha-tubulin suppressor-like RCC1 family protein
MPSLSRVYFAPSLEAVASPSDLASGRTHSCALFLPKSLVCWGSNGNGELGAAVAGSSFGGASGEMALLAPVSFEKNIAAESIAQIALGFESTCSM